MIRNWILKRMPHLSLFEEQALKTGGSWWEKQIFFGRLSLNDLTKIPAPQLTEEERYFIDHPVEQLCQLLDDWAITQKEHDLSAEVWKIIKKEKFWGLVIHKKYGGLQFSAVAHSTIITKIASRSVSAAISIMVPNSLGPAEFIQLFGTEQQKQYYLPRLVEGQEIACFALTSAQAGSDAYGMTDTGVVTKGFYQGEEVLGIRLNWDKRYITLAPIATLIGLAFKLKDPDHLLGDQENIGITVAVVPTNLPGVEQGERHYPLHLAFMNGPIRGRDVFIPIDFVIGGVKACGHGWEMMMECLALGRGISLPSLATASAKLSTRMSGAYARIREQFNRPIGEFEGVASVLAKMAGFTYLCEATRLFNALAVDQGTRPSVASAIAKYHLTEMARHVVNDAMDIHAGRGIQIGPRNYLANLYNAAPIGITVEGANILTRNLMIYGQGVMKSHPYLSREIVLAASNNDVEIKEFNQLFMRHILHLVKQFFRCLTVRFTHSDWIEKYFYQLNRMSNAFALVGDITLAILGGSLKEKELLSGRLGDILSYLYMGSAAVKYFIDHQKPHDERDILEWVLQYCLYKTQEAFLELFSNYPWKGVGKFLRRWIFPWGLCYRAPTDALSLRVAKSLQEDPVWRDKLTSYCFVSHDPQDVTGRVEVAFQEILATQSLRKKLKNGLILTPEETVVFNKAEERRREAIQVDVFKEIA